MFLGTAPLVFEEFGGRANAPGAGMDLYAEVGGFGSDFLEVLLFETVVGVEIRNESGIQLERCSVIQQGGCFPVHRANGEVVEAELEFSFWQPGRIFRKARPGQGQAGADSGHGLQECPSICFRIACVHLLAELLIVSIGPGAAPHPCSTEFPNCWSARLSSLSARSTALENFIT